MADYGMTSLTNDLVSSVKAAGASLGLSLDETVKTAKIADNIFYQPSNTVAGSQFFKDYFYKDSFLDWAGIDGTDFRKQFGYSFQIIDASNNNIVASIALPLAPQNISINVPAAVATTVTMNGIVEEHNGAPLRSINISGTTGVLPILPSAPPKDDPLMNNMKFLFGGTIQAANNLTSTIDTIKKGVASLTGEPVSYNKGLNYASSNNTGTVGVGFKSGYAYFHKLARFFDTYLAMKKSSNGKRLRLVFRMEKDQMYYYVTLNGYSFTKSAGTIEYQYGINLTAWKRISSIRQPAVKLVSNVDKTSEIAKVLGIVRGARTAVSQAFGIASSIRNDIVEAVILPAKELGLFLSTLNGGMEKTITEYGSMFNAIGQAYDQISYIATSTSSVTIDKVELLNNELSGQVQYTIPGLPLFKKGNEKSTSADMQSSLYFEGISPSSLKLSLEQQKQVAQDEEKASLLGINDFKNKRDGVVNAAAAISEAFGGGANTYNRIAGLSPPKKVYKEINTSDLDLLDKLNDLIMAFDKAIGVIESATPDESNDYSEYFTAEARRNDIPMGSYSSRFYVPFPHGGSLEQLSLQYLGDASKWLDIVAINGLKSPYIDEDGFTIPFMGNGSGSTITIANTSGLYIGQAIMISSDKISSSKRKIQAISVISAAEMMVTVSGDANLSSYLVKDNAKFQAYLPDTVNSNMLIAIPSSAPANVPGKIRTIPGIDDLNGMERLAKVDFMLQSDGDLIVSSSGDISLSHGLGNIVQASLIKLKTPYGSLLNDPGFGNILNAGISTADIDPKKLVAQLDKMFSDDQRFQGVASAKVSIKGPVGEINLLLQVADTDVFLPLSTQIPI